MIKNKYRCTIEESRPISLSILSIGYGLTSNVSSEEVIKKIAEAKRGKGFLNIDFIRNLY